MPINPGDLVYRKLPTGAKLPKRLFSDNVRGPYRVARRKGMSVVLADLNSGAELDAGALVPVDQLIMGPA